MFVYFDNRVGVHIETDRQEGNELFLRYIPQDVENLLPAQLVVYAPPRYIHKEELLIGEILEGCFESLFGIRFAERDFQHFEEALKPLRTPDPKGVQRYNPYAPLVVEDKIGNYLCYSGRLPHPGGTHEGDNLLRFLLLQIFKLEELGKGFG